jgi:type I restriction enzyme M protein
LTEEIPRLNPIKTWIFNITFLPLFLAESRFSILTMNANQLRQLEDNLWKTADQLRANSKLTASEYSQPVLGLIFLRHAFNRFEKVREEVEKNLPVHPQRGKRPVNKNDFLKANAMFLPEQARFDKLVGLPEEDDIGKGIEDAMKAIEDEYPNLVGVLPRNYSIFSADLLRGVLRLFNAEVLQKAEGDVFGKIYEYFLNKFAMTGAQEGGEFFTPFSLVNTIVKVIEPDHGIVFDPACGSAGMFVQTGYFIEEEGSTAQEQVTFYGQEKTDTNTKLAKMNLAVHGLEGNILEGNTFYEDKHDLVGKCDFVMANPPFNVDGVNKDKEGVKKDPRLPFGLPKNDNANYLWIQYFYSYLKPTGRAGFVMASSASDAGHTERDIREKLINSGAVDVMVAVGNNFFYTRSLPCTLWFFDRAKETDSAQKEKVLMLDARKIYRKVTQKINDFSDEQLQNIASIVGLYRGNRNKFLQTVKLHIINASESAWQIVDVTKPTVELIAEIADPLQAFIASNKSNFNFDDDVLPLLSGNSILLKIAADLELLEENIRACLPHHSNIIWNDNPDKLNKILRSCTEAMRQDLLQKTIKPFRKEIDRNLKLFSDVIETVEKKYNLRKMKDWIALDLKDMFRQLRETFDQISQLIHNTLYFQHQAEWLQIRFPDARFIDVEGLCKIVSRREIAGKEYSLSPGRFVGVDNAGNVGVDYVERLNEIHIELDVLNEESVQFANTISENFKEIVI